MAASTLTTAAFIFKRVYSGRAPGDLAMREHILLQKLSKEDGFTGQGTNTYSYAIRYGNPQGVSGTFSSAQSGASVSKGVQMSAVRRAKFGVITVDGEAIASSRDNKGAFMRLLTTETDGILEEMGDSFAFDAYQAGNGIRGQRDSAATNVITLAIVDDARNFKVGMTVGASANADGSSPRTGSTTVTAVDEDNGTVTLTSAAAITSFADNDYLFRVGDPGTCMDGLEDHLPLAAPVLGVDSFRGVDRGADPRRLAGVRVDDTASPIEENLGLVAVKISQVGKRANTGLLNPINFWQVVRRLNAKVEYEDGGGTANYGFEYISVHSPAGTVRVYSDADCPTNRGYVMNMSTWYLKHLDPLPHIIQDDGRPSLRSTSEDSIEARARGWVNLCCTQPGANGVFSITAS